MTTCEYCYSADAEECGECSRVVCPDHRHEAGQVVLCDPPSYDVDAGRGCYKPPVAEVADDSR